VVRIRQLEEDLGVALFIREGKLKGPVEPYFRDAPEA
jgi:hypothetical protein